MNSRHLWYFAGKWCSGKTWVIAFLLMISCSDNPSLPVEDDTDAEVAGSIPEEVNPDIGIAAYATKISQLVGDFDRELSEPTNNLTNTRYRLEATDLGVPFRYGDRTYILFGDTWGAVGGNRDAYAYTTDSDPEDGLDLTFVTDDGNTYYPLTVPGISQAAYEVPTEGVSVGGRMYVYHTTDHSAQAAMGRSVLARAEDQAAKTFTNLYDFSTQKFINLSIVKVNSADWAMFPENSGEGLVILGSGSYRKSQVYLAFQPASEIEDRSAIRYFAGIDRNGKPLWKNTEEDALPIFKLADPCVGELSVSYNPFIKRWILLYNCEDPRGINLRTAEYPWGPWTRSQILFHPWNNGGYCHFMHASYESQQCDRVQDPGRDNEWGGEYGPYQFESFAKGDELSTTIFFTMSTWNPYTVVLMKAGLSISKSDSGSSPSLRRLMKTGKRIEGSGSDRAGEILARSAIPYRSSALFEDIRPGRSAVQYLNETLPDESIRVDRGPDVTAPETNGIRMAKAGLDVKTIQSQRSASIRPRPKAKGQNHGFGLFRVEGILDNLSMPHRSSALLEDIHMGQSVICYLNETLPDGSKLVDIGPDYITLEKNGVRQRSYLTGAGDEINGLFRHGDFPDYRKIDDAEWDLKPYRVFDGNVDDILDFSIDLKHKNSRVEGLQIGNIEHPSIAAELGFKDGDVIVEVNGVAVNSLYRCIKACYDAGNSDEVLLKIRRQNRCVTLKYNLNWEGSASWSASDVLHSTALMRLLD